MLNVKVLVRRGTDRPSSPTDRLSDICGHVEKIRRGNLERVFGAAFVKDVEEGERLIKVTSGQS